MPMLIFLKQVENIKNIKHWKENIENLLTKVKNIREQDITEKSKKEYTLYKIIISY